MDDADYHRIFAETGTNTLEVEFGAAVAEPLWLQGGAAQSSA